MSKESVKTLSEAIAKIESVSQSKSQQFKEHLEKDYDEVKSALESLKPYFEDVRQKVEHEAKDAKNKVENRVKENPWMAIGLVGLVAFLIGLILGRRDR
jgi:ElaB/YqjD/DUF883 family membrane-anchored ribosome-binding protein